MTRTKAQLIRITVFFVLSLVFMGLALNSPEPGIELGPVLTMCIASIVMVAVFKFFGIMP